MTQASDPDPRWDSFQNTEWTCHSCGEKHHGVIDMAFDRPLYWAAKDAPRPNSELDCSGSILTEDFCVLDGEHFFVRTVLLLPLVGKPDDFFGLGVWSSLSKQNFDLYVETFDEGNQGRLGPWFSWLSSGLNGYPDCLQLKSRIIPQDNKQRPLVELEVCDHPLAMEQRDGITFERLLEVYGANGHDIDPILFN